jgi:hypothetical protein
VYSCRHMSSTSFPRRLPICDCDFHFPSVSSWRFERGGNISTTPWQQTLDTQHNSTRVECHRQAQRERSSEERSKVTRFNRVRIKMKFKIKTLAREISWRQSRKSRLQIYREMAGRTESCICFYSTPFVRKYPNCFIFIFFRIFCHLGSLKTPRCRSYFVGGSQESAACLHPECSPIATADTWV